jgi:hypothetical protein
MLLESLPALSVILLAMVIITASSLSAKLLLPAGDAEINPDPMSSQSPADGLPWLVATAPANV